ncbi:uncharacterized protein LOC124161489 [Ischnura elegans]|uniref:uncharacterized protein LOC124161489 n=1 Tax=Ischnura elegans TaxID=197161 RepID=UPI001ED8ACBE|nr:uncharacterized protein LOC124161489 [Ischnura elegans]XP_046393770.1 uncharacterized protein LOC124161489 [Ischnura elegans]
MAYNIILSEVSKLYELEQVQVNVQSSLKGGMAVGGAATVGSLFMGPVGLLIGGVVGSALTSWGYWGTYRSLVSIISEDLTPKQQEQLVNALQRALEQASPEDLLKLLVLMSAGGAQAALREVAVGTVKNFAAKELGLHLC